VLPDQLASRIARSIGWHVRRATGVCHNDLVLSIEREQDAKIIGELVGIAGKTIPACSLGFARRSAFSLDGRSSLFIRLEAGWRAIEAKARPIVEFED
jgi:hypothetical protein